MRERKSACIPYHSNFCPMCLHLIFSKELYPFFAKGGISFQRVVSLLFKGWYPSFLKSLILTSKGYLVSLPLSLVPCPLSLVPCCQKDKRRVRVSRIPCWYPFEALILYPFFYPLFYVFKQGCEGKRAFCACIVPCKGNAQGIQALSFRRQKSFFLFFCMRSCYPFIPSSLLSIEGIQIFFCACKGYLVSLPLSLVPCPLSLVKETRKGYKKGIVRTSKEYSNKREYIYGIRPFLLF